MSNSALVSYTNYSPNRSAPRNHAIDKITIHHTAGVVSAESLGAMFASPSRRASSNYGIGNDGRIGLFVDEADRSWCSSDAVNDNRAVTIEVSNSEVGGEWRVSDAALESLLELCTDICRRNGIEQLNFTGDASGNLTMHKYFVATACPGPYLESLFPQIAAEVNRRLRCGSGDVNGDGKVSLQDATALMRRFAGSNDQIDAAAADVNGDGKVNMQDVTGILRKLTK